MRILLLLIVALSAVVFFIKPIQATAHASDPHGKATDAQMKKLHVIMPTLSAASADLESALEKGDAAAAMIQADRILAAIPALKNSKPHKNIKQRKKFVTFATTLEEAITSTAVLAKQGDFARAKAAFKNAEKACAACHAKFRD